MVERMAVNHEVVGSIPISEDLIVNDNNTIVVISLFNNDFMSEMNAASFYIVILKTMINTKSKIFY